MTQKRKQFQRTEDGHLLLMSNEERNLLITDLTARLNYGVICLIERVDDFGPIHRDEKLTGFCFEDSGYFHFEVGGGLDISFAENIMPYLRPLSSMTEEEFIKLTTATELQYNQLELVEWDNDCKTLEFYLSEIPHYCVIKVFDWLNAHHFDYRGLIEKGLAREAPEGMYENESLYDA